MTLESWPDELILQLLYVVEPADVVKCIKPLSRRFRRIANDNYLWSKVCSRELGGTHRLDSWLRSMNERFSTEPHSPTLNLRDLGVDMFPVHRFWSSFVRAWAPRLGWWMPHPAHPDGGVTLLRFEVDFSNGCVRASEYRMLNEAQGNLMQLVPTQEPGGFTSIIWVRRLEHSVVKDPLCEICFDPATEKEVTIEDGGYSLDPPDHEIVSLPNLVQLDSWTDVVQLHPILTGQVLGDGANCQKWNRLWFQLKEPAQLDAEFSDAYIRSGWFCGSFSTSCQFIWIHTTDSSLENLSKLGITAEEGWPSGRWIIGTKVTGDSVVAGAQTTFIGFVCTAKPEGGSDPEAVASLIPESSSLPAGRPWPFPLRSDEHEQPSADLLFSDEGITMSGVARIANSGFESPVWEDCVVHIASRQEVQLRWLSFDHVSTFRRLTDGDLA